MFTVNTFAPTMKRVFVIMLMLLYGLTASGMSLQVHFCCGKIAGIDLTPQKGCGMEHEMGSMPCCETKALEVKNLGAYEPEHLVIQGLETPVLIIPASETAIIPHNQQKQPLRFTMVPPLLHDGIYQWICVYRI